MKTTEFWGRPLTAPHRAHLHHRLTRATANLERLMHNPAHRHGRRIQYWANLTERLEKRLYDIPPPTPEEAALFRAEQEGRA